MTNVEETIVASERLQKAAARLVALRENSDEAWNWLSQSGPLDRKSANKFLLGCILNYQMQTPLVWENARRLAEDKFGDPEDLWQVIASVQKEDWGRQFSTYKLHRFPQAHFRVWRIAQSLVRDYDGDARNIWHGQSQQEVQKRFKKIDMGCQIERMTLGALIDAGILEGPNDVKADLHVCRVLGRILLGRPLKVEEATAFTRKMHPSNPWLLDGPLYDTGKKFCHANNPKCVQCPVQQCCVFGTKQ